MTRTHMDAAEASPLLQGIIASGTPLSDSQILYLEAFLDTQVGPYAPTFRQVGQPLAELAVREELVEMDCVAALAAGLRRQLEL